MQRVLRIKSVVQATGLSRSSIYDLVGKKLFPQPVPLTGKAVGFIESEVSAWIDARIEAREKKREAA